MKSKQKQLLFAIIIGVVAIVANKFYIESRLDEYRPKKMVEVVRAKKPIPAGTTLRRAAVERVKIPKNFVPLVATRWQDLENYVGQEIAVDVPAGDYLLENYFSLRRAVGNKLSDQIEGENYRAVTLPVDQTNSLATSIVAGDLIDIIFTFKAPGIQGKMSVVLLQNIPVIATGSYSVVESEVGGRGGRPKKYNTLTLRLTAHDSVRVTYARQAGKIDIVLRNSSDSNVIDFKPIAGVEDLLSAEDKQMLQERAQAFALPDVERDKLRKQLRDLFEQQRKQKQG